jgi:hypothetical protein
VSPRADVAVKKSGAWGRVQESGSALDLQAARESASGVESHRFLCC